MHCISIEVLGRLGLNRSVGNCNTMGCCVSGSLQLDLCPEERAICTKEAALGFQKHSAAYMAAVASAHATDKEIEEQSFRVLLAELGLSRKDLAQSDSPLSGMYGDLRNGKGCIDLVQFRLLAALLSRDSTAERRRVLLDSVCSHSTRTLTAAQVHFLFDSIFALACSTLPALALSSRTLDFPALQTYINRLQHAPVLATRYASLVLRDQQDVTVEAAEMRLQQEDLLGRGAVGLRQAVFASGLL